MGPRLKLPRFVHGFIDRHGKPRFYFRRRGFKQTPLPGLPHSTEFLDAYQAALGATPHSISARGAPRLARLTRSSSATTSRMHGRIASGRTLARRVVA